MSVRLLLLIGLVMGANAATHADGSVTIYAVSPNNPGGILGNSYASQLQRLDATTLVITARNRVSGDINEANKPGTSVYKALRGAQNSALARAVIEANALGYAVIQLVTWNDLTTVSDKRNANADMGNGLREKNFAFAPGHYTDDIEVAMELTVRLVPGSLPAKPPKDYVDVKFVLAQLGLVDVSASSTP